MYKVTLSSLDARVTKLEQEMITAKSDIVTVKTQVEKISSDTDVIIDLMTNGKKLVGYTVRYGRPILTFIVGVALAAGWINADVADALRSIPL